MPRAPEPPDVRERRTAAARAAAVRRTAEARAADPAKLRKALRTVLAGVRRLSAEEVEQIRALLPPAPDNGDQAA
jgi:hypothetical protein